MGSLQVWARRRPPCLRSNVGTFPEYVNGSAQMRSEELTKAQALVMLYHIPQARQAADVLTLFPADTIDRSLELHRLRAAIRDAHIAHARGQIPGPGRLDAGGLGREYHVKTG